MTWLRKTPLQHIVPFDLHLRMHRQLAYHFFIWAWLHVVCHIVNAAHVTDPKRASSWQAYGETFEQPGPNGMYTPVPQPTQAQYYTEPTQVIPPSPTLLRPRLPLSSRQSPGCSDEIVIAPMFPPA